jgi:hypothetical protein
MRDAESSQAPSGPEVRKGLKTFIKHREKPCLQKQRPVSEQGWDE